MDSQMAKDVETVKAAAGLQGKGTDTRTPESFDRSATAEDLQPHAYQRLSGTNYCALTGCNAPEFADIHDGIPQGVQLPSKVEVSYSSTEELPDTEGLTATRKEKPASYSTGTYDAVNPPHYQRGPVLHLDIGEKITRGIGRFDYALKCIDVFRAIKDPRLATAFKYIWRVAFGGKCEPGMERATQRQRDTRDITSAVWYLQDWLDHEV